MTTKQMTIWNIIIIIFIIFFRANKDRHFMWKSSLIFSEKEDNEI